MVLKNDTLGFMVLPFFLQLKLTTGGVNVKRGGHPIMQSISAGGLNSLVGNWGFDFRANF
jgi:hypothetical protein